MKASVVICTLNRERLLRDTLQAISTQRAPAGGYEVIVVDNGSADGTPTVAAAFAAGAPVPIRYVVEPNLGLSFARNTGIRAAAGELVAFVDDDIDAGPEWLCALTGGFEDGRVACAGGPIRPLWPHARPDWLTKEWEPYLGITEFEAVRATGEFRGPAYPWGGNIAFRRDIFEVIGMFPTDLGRIGRGLLSNEEISVCQRIEAAGRTIRFVPDAVIFHKILPERLTKQYFYHRTFYQGRSDAMLDQRSARMNYARIRDFAAAMYWTYLDPQADRFDAYCRRRLFLGYFAQLLSPAANGAATSESRRLRALKTLLVKIFQIAAASGDQQAEMLARTESLVRLRDEWLAERDRQIADVERDRDNWRRLAEERHAALDRESAAVDATLARLRRQWWMRLGVRLRVMPEVERSKAARCWNS